MRFRLATLSMLAAVVLAGCGGGGGGTIPAAPATNDGGTVPAGTSIVFERSTLWVAYPLRANAFPANTSGNATPAAVLGAWPWESGGANPGFVDISIALDGTKWVLENRDFVFGGAGWRMFAYDRHSNIPENRYGNDTDTPMAVGLAGDGIMVLAYAGGPYTITSYPYASNFPQPLRTFTSPTRIVSFAEGNDSRLYVAREDRVDVYLPTSTGCCPIRSVPVAVPNTTGTHGFALGPDNSIYVYAGPNTTAAASQFGYVSVYDSTTGALLRKIGPFPATFDPLTTRSPIAVDSSNRLYVATNGQIMRFAADANGAATPQRVWTDAQAGGGGPVALTLGTPL
jgi:hypothetical protein